MIKKHLKRKIITSMFFIIILNITIQHYIARDYSRDYFNNTITDIFKTNFDIETYNSSWTLMMYLDGDNNLEKYAVRICNQMKRGIEETNNITIVILLDRHPDYYILNGDWFDSRLFVFTSNTQNSASSGYIENWGESKMDDNSTLEKFVSFCMTHFKAEHYLLTLYNHGAGIWGTCSDETSEVSEDDVEMLSIEEIQLALQNALINSNQTKIDILLMCSCDMALIENVYAFRNICDYFLASQESSYSGDFNFRKFLKLFIDDELSPKELVIKIVDLYEKKWQNNRRLKTTFSAIDIIQITNTSVLDNFANFLKIAITEGKYIKDIIEARKNTIDFYDAFDSKDGINTQNFNTFPGKCFIDIIDFIDNILSKESLITSYPQIQESGLEFKNQLEDAILNNYQCKSLNSKANGLSIYFPYNHFNVYDKKILSYVSSDGNLYKQIDWIQDTEWYKFLKTFFYNDFDVDFLYDWFEIEYNLDFLNNDTDNNGNPDYEDDFDNDLLTNFREYINGTDPTKNDTDNDLLSDHSEIYYYYTDPLNPDSDSDNFNDGKEVFKSTNPNNNKSKPCVGKWISIGLTTIIIGIIISFIAYNKLKSFVYNNMRFS